MYLYSLLIQLNFIFQWILSQVDAHQFGRICSHDPSILEKIMPQEYYDSIEERSKRRILETGSAQPFRVTTDYSYLDDPTNGSDMNDTKKKYIIKIMQASQMFLKNFIKVIPRSTPIKKRGDTTCYDVTVPNYLKDSGNGQTDSDLHILVTFENSPNSSNLANAVACDFDPGPIVGRIKFNIGTMKNIGTTAWAFESDFSTAIHEITHILGFSSSAMQYWIDPDTNKPYGKDGVSKIQIKDTVRGISDVIKLKSKNVLETARRYYNCPTLDSLPMENQGGSGSFGSHWERDLIQNEYMTASSVQGHAVISEFTASLLLDTGFYAEINTNMVEQTYWGKDKGCDFITQSCDNSQQKYPEFSYQDNDHLCDYYSLGQGYAKSDKLDPFSQCKQIQIYSNQYCFDEISYQPNQVLRNNSGQGSKCFFSTSIQNGFSLSGNDDGIRCHKYECNLDNTQINVILWNEIKVSCTTPQQIIDLSNYQQQIDTKGNLNCPQILIFFVISLSLVPIFAMEMAVCYCLDGFAGEDCSKQCAPSLVWDGNKCVTVCPDQTFQNPDNTCKQTCPKAYYQKADIKTCILCHKTCSNCTGPLNSQCSECNSGYYLQGTTCQDQLICDATCLTCTGQTKNQCLTCQDGKFLDSLNSCQICQTPCSKCADSTSKCTGCVIDYNFNPSSNSCSPICDQTCLTCSSPKDSNKCLSCIDGFFLSSGKCIQCQSPCSTCIDTSTKCLKCIENYKLDNIYCIPICDNQCKTCSKPYDSNSCTSCNDGLFLKGTTCISCSHPCQKCDSSSIKCLSCISNYSYNNQNFECNPICHSSCKTCSLPNDFQSCQSCNEGSFLSGAQCLLCTSPCKTCDQQTQKCLSCLDGYFLSQNACKQCQNPCQNCQDETKCLSCISNDYNYDQNSHKCICKCHTDCKSCSGPTQQDCTDCFDSYYLENNICKKCLSPCNNCNRSQDTCTSCINGYNLNGNQCIINCDSSCKTCNTPNDSNNCSSCKDGFYLDKGACKNCQSPCSNCKESATKCLDCNLNYKLESSQCNPICDTTCKTCSNPLDDKSCISCFDGFYLQNSKCLKCQSPCETCIQNSSKCLTCQNGYKLSLNNPNSCELTCDSSCLTCSQYQNPKACLTCSDGKYLESKQCKYCPANCALCSDSSKCQKCQPNYQINLKTEQCELICDQSCVTCSQPKNPKACLTCTPQQILVNGSCQECQPGSYINSEKCSNCPENCKVCKDSNYCEQCYSDYFLDANKSCKQNPKNFQCHYSCKTCQGTSYSDCKSCASDRILNIKYKDPKNSQAIWICECPKETSDFNELGCDKSKIQSQLKTTTTAFFISSGSTTAFMSIASANPLVIGGLFDFCQTVSFFTYVNEKPALGFDNAAQNLYVSHITKIFDFSKLSSNNHSRILQVGQQQNESSSYSNNSKIILNDKYPEFVVNALSLLILTCLTWLLSGLSILINQCKPNQFSFKIKKIFCISFPLCTFVLTSQELSLLIFFQLQQLSLENSINGASAFLSFIALFYILGILGFLFFKLNYQKVLTKLILNPSSSEQENQAQPIFDEATYQIKIQYNITNQEYFTFYIIYLFIRQNTFINRAFVQILVIKKIITSLIMTFGYQNPIAQVSLLLVLYIFYWLFIILSKPFMQINHTRVYIFVETITLIICILYLTLLNDSSNYEKQKIISLVMLVLINVALAFYLLVSLVYIFQLIKQCFKKYRSKNNNVDALNNIELEQRNSLYDQVFTDNNKSQNKFVYMDYKSNSNYIKKQSCNNQEKKRSSILDNSFSNQQNKYPSIKNRMQINHDSIYCEDTNNKRVGDNQQWNFDQIDRQMQIQKNRVYRLEYYRYYMPHKSQKVKNFGGGIF